MPGLQEPSVPTGDPLTMVIRFDLNCTTWRSKEEREAAREIPAAKEYAARMGTIATPYPWPAAVGMSSPCRT
ncbi:hypothetical protein GCM10010423_29770 [Streptomyces levis]|uniref:Uncharacterized protein n=1 Tax=Streptomyces levis TaxID=285566 RepID=A0ABN3NTR4_9ACTN